MSLNCGHDLPCLASLPCSVLLSGVISESPRVNTLCRTPFNSGIPAAAMLGLRTSRMSNKLSGEERVERWRLLLAVSVLVLFVVVDAVIIISRSIAAFVIKCRSRRRDGVRRSESSIVTESHLSRRHFNHDCKLHQLCARSLKMQSPAAAAATGEHFKPRVR